ncbi:MAG: hypothetical protein KBG84_13620 [Planctomycetes bacterium]|nr:hypothetical protein [Planctomycetota bacterium]
MNHSAHLCPCCAVHLCIQDGLTTLRCDNCSASLVMVRFGGVSGLLLLPDSAPVPYSDPRIAVRLLDGAQLARDSWRAVLYRKLRKRSALMFAFMIFASLTGLSGFASLAALHDVTYADRHTIESATAMFLGGLGAIPVLGFVASFFWDRFLVASIEVGDARRHMPREDGF